MGLFNSAIGDSTSYHQTTQNEMGEKVVGPTPPVGTPLYALLQQAAQDRGMTGGGLGIGSGAGGNVSDAYRKAEQASQGSLASAQSAVTNAQNTAAGIRGNSAGARDALKSAYGSVNQLGADASLVRKSAANLSGYADQIGKYGAQLFADASGLNQSGTSILNGDTGVGGILGQYIGNVSSINPDAYVSMAAADQQSSYENMLGQLMRSMGRSGANPSSGNANAMKQDWARVAAAAVAGAKTRARLQGLSDQRDALSSALQTAMGFKQAAAQNTQSAANVTSQGADVIQKQGSLFATAAELEKEKTSMFANIAGMEVDLGNLDLAATKTVNDAIAGATAAQQAMSQFYSGFAPQTTTETDGYLENLYPELFGKSTTVSKS